MKDFLFVAGCVGAIAGGIAVTFAYGMSDSPSDSKKTDLPLVVAAIGVVGIVVEIGRLIAHYI